MIFDGVEYFKFEYDETNGRGKRVMRGIAKKLTPNVEFLGIYRRPEVCNNYYLLHFLDCGHVRLVQAGKEFKCKDPKCKHDRHSIIMTESHNRTEFVEGARQRALKQTSTKEWRDNHSKKMQNYWSSEENHKKMSAIVKKRFSKQEERDKQSQRQRLANIRNPQLRENNRNRILEKWQNPVYREKVIKAQLKGNAEHQRQLKNKEEVWFSNFLDSYNLVYDYQVPIYTGEDISFILDFYIPKYDLYINIDGGIHYRPDIMERDSKLDEYCKRNHIKFKRILVDQLYDTKIENLF